jgi:hydrogenase expression/formation protein HypC
MIMCLAIPCKILEIQNDSGTIEFAGVKRKISLLFVEDAKVGDYVIVHAGFAIHRIDESTALESLSMLRQGLGLFDEGT